MATRAELLRKKEEIEEKLRILEKKEYFDKIVVLSNPDVNEGRFPFLDRKEFYVTGSTKDVENLQKLIESIYAKKYGLYDGVMGNRFVLMETFKVLHLGADSEDSNDLTILNISNLSRNFDVARKEISDFLENVPSKSYLAK